MLVVVIEVPAPRWPRHAPVLDAQPWGQLGFGLSDWARVCSHQHAVPVAAVCLWCPTCGATLPPIDTCECGTVKVGGRCSTCRSIDATEARRHLLEVPHAKERRERYSPHRGRRGRRPAAEAARHKLCRCCLGDCGDIVRVVEARKHALDKHGEVVEAADVGECFELEDAA